MKSEKEGVFGKRVAAFTQESSSVTITILYQLMERLSKKSPSRFLGEM